LLGGRSGRRAKAAIGEEALRLRNLKKVAASGNWTDAGAEAAGDREILKNVWGVSCGGAHSQARKREMVTQGYTAILVAATLAVS
jgi:hypothetical protein